MNRFALVCVLFLLCACSLPTSANFPGVDTELTVPSAGEIFTVGQPILLYAGASYPAAGPTVDHFTFYANALQVGDSPLSTIAGDSGTYSDGTPYVSGYANWTPAAAGEYQMQAWGRLSNGRLAISNPVTICVLDISFAGTPTYPSGAAPYPSGLPIAPQGYTGPCELPSAPVTDPTAPVTLTTTPSPISIGFPTASCPGVGPADITFTSHVTDPGSRVAFVIVNYSIHFNDPAHDVDLEHPLVLNPTVTVGTDKTFSGTTPELVELESPASAAFTSSIEWTAYAYDRTGAIVATDGPHDLLAAPCSPPVLPEVIGPTSTPTVGILIILPTATPASALDCPSGTYFAPNSYKCILILTSTPKGGNSGGPNCSKITSSAVCNATPGCSYNFVLKVCK